MKLLCLFTNKNQVDYNLDYIKNNFETLGSCMFIHECECGYFITFTSSDIITVKKNIILIHRKSETNTLYSINALNQIILDCNNGILDKSFKLDWSLYKDQLLLSSDGMVKRYKFQLLEKKYV